MADVFPGDVESYIRSKGWAVSKIEKHKNGPQLVLEQCPLCGKKAKSKTDRNFYLDEGTGQWLTYCCEEKGNLFTLRQRMGDIGVSPLGTVGKVAVDAFAARLAEMRGTNKDPNLPPVTSAPYYAKRLWGDDGKGSVGLAYLHGRGFEDETIRECGFGMARRGFCKKCEIQTSLRPDDGCPKCGEIVSNAHDMLAIPYIVNGRVRNFKFRSLAGEKRFERWTGAPTAPWGRDTLDGEHKRLLMCEAELDGGSLRQVGYPAVLSLGGASNDPDDETLDRIAMFDEIVLAYDNDEAGTKATARLAEKLGKFRCRTVVWPKGIKDANQCLQEMGGKGLRGVVEASIAVATNPLKSVDSYIADLKAMKGQGQTLFGRPTRWLSVNELMGGGFRDGELTVVTGDSGDGKSTWCCCAAWDQATNAQSPVSVLIASFEVLPRIIARKLAQMDIGKSFAAMTEQEIETSLLRMASNVYLLDKHGRMAIGDLCDAVTYAVRRFSVKFVVVDHLHFFLEAGEDERRSIETAVRRFSDLAHDLMVPVVLVVHPTKLRVVDGRPTKVEMNDLRGAAAIKQDADNVIRVYKIPKATLPGNVGPCAEIATLKVRDDAGRTDATILAFDLDSLRYEFDAMTIQKILDASKSKKSSGRKKRSGGAETAPLSFADATAPAD